MDKFPTVPPTNYVVEIISVTGRKRFHVAGESLEDAKKWRDENYTEADRQCVIRNGNEVVSIS